MTVPDIVIVGGGVNGCAAAYHLAREGHAVTVVERYAPAAMASGWTLAGVRQSAPEVDGLVIACGFSGHGFGIAPVTGRVLRDLVLGEPPLLPLDAFRRARFADASELEWAAAPSLLG